MGETLFTTVICIILVVPATVPIIYFGAKAARYGWLRGEELFMGRRLKRNLRPEELPDDET